MTTKQSVDKQEVIRFLKHEKLLDNIVVVVQSTGIVGEDIPIKAEILICCGKRVINRSSTSTNLHPEDQSGVGKDFVTEGVNKIVFYKDWEPYHIPSPTAITYGQRKQETKVDGEKMVKRERNPITSETIIYIKDASEKFLNGDDAKLLFEGDVDITRTIDGRSCRIQWKKPVVIITTAGTDTKHQLLRRVPSLPLNSSAEQTKKIVDKQWNDSSNIIKQQNDNHNIDKKQKIAKDAFYELQNLYVDTTAVLDYAKEMLPKCSLVAMRTLNKRLIDYIDFSAVLHQFQRKKLGKITHVDGKEYNVIEAVKQDVDIGYEIFNYIYYTEFADISFLNKRQRSIHSHLKQHPTERFSAGHINLLKESEGVSRPTTYADVKEIVRADPAVQYDETSYPKGFYYAGTPPVDSEEKHDSAASSYKAKELKEFCTGHYDKDETISYNELIKVFPESFIGDAIQSGLLSEVSHGQYHYNGVDR